MANSITNGISYLPGEYVTDGNAVFNTLQQLGGAVGTAAATSIVNGAQAAIPNDLVAGTIAGGQACTAMMLAVAVAALLCMAGVFAGREKPLRG